LTPSVLAILRCPVTGSPLLPDGLRLIGGDRAYPIVDGIPHLLREQQVSEIDRFFQTQYTEQEARRYDRVVTLMTLLLGLWLPAERRRMVSHLKLKPGDRVLEISVGTGANLPYIAAQVGRAGEIVALDLSLHMMAVARERAGRLPVPVCLVRGDAVRLPFAESSFDAVFHWGGLNMFGDIGRSLSEMVRVAKPGARIVAGDEGLSERRRSTWFGRRLRRLNSLFGCRPPFASVPWSSLEHVELHWNLREAFYLLVMRKAVGGIAAPADLRGELSRRVGSG
jgi:SAM-dependent methyltransferase